MGLRKTVFAQGEIYHIFSRGVEKRKIFANAWDYKRFIQAMQYYQLQNPPIRLSKFLLNKDDHEIRNKKKLIDIFVYCLMPTHFHFALKQLTANGISIFMKRLLNSYVRYFNIKNSRKGPLFEGNFKAVRVDSEEQFIHLSRYIHLNPITDFLVKNLKDYSYSSYLEYIGLSEARIIDKKLVFSFFDTPKDYKGFVLSRVEYQRQLKEIKDVLLD